MKKPAKKSAPKKTTNKKKAVKFGQWIGGLTGGWVLLGEAYETYGKLEPLFKTIWSGLGLGFTSALPTQPTRSAEEAFENEAIALGILAQVLRELRNAKLPIADYEADDMAEVVWRVVREMITTERYIPVLPLIEKVALKQKIELELKTGKVKKAPPLKI